MRVVFLSLIFYLFLLWYGINFLSFSIVDIKSIENFPILNNILDVSIYLFGKNDFAIRIPGIIMGFLSTLLFYKLTFFYLKKEKDRFFSTFIFMLIPGMIISSLVINKSIYIIFSVLLFAYLYKSLKVLSYFLLFFFIFLDKSYISLYFALVFYALYKRDNFLLVLSLIFLALNANYFNYAIKGKPKGYFLDIFGTYFLIFSPFVFLYFLYSIYKGVLDKKKDIVFFIAFFAFIISTILSFRQRIKIDDYAPFTLIFIIYMVKYFLNSFRVRLPKFRTMYKFIFGFLFGSLILFDLVLFFNSYTPAKNLTNSYYFIKPLVKILKEHKINYIKSNNKYLQTALNFYGINSGDKYILIYKKNKKVSIFHKNRKLLEIDVSKLNTI